MWSGQDTMRMFGEGGDTLPLQNGRCRGPVLGARVCGICLYKNGEYSTSYNTGNGTQEWSMSPVKRKQTLVKAQLAEKWVTQDSKIWNRDKILAVQSQDWAGQGQTLPPFTDGGTEASWGWLSPAGAVREWWDQVGARWDAPGTGLCFWGRAEGWWNTSCVPAPCEAFWADYCFYFS